MVSMPLSAYVSADRKAWPDRQFLVAARVVAFVTAAIAATPSIATATDLSPQLMARFTKHVQPLLLNKCAAGACHGGPSAHAPHFNRGDVSGRIDRGVTLANIETLFRVTDQNGNATPFLTTISARHPASATATSLTMKPLTTAERATLEQWLIAATGRDFAASRPMTQSSAAQATAIQPPNRFRAMLDAAANPAPLPPPQEPQGILLGKDSQ